MESSFLSVLHRKHNKKGNKQINIVTGSDNDFICQKLDSLEKENRGIFIRHKTRLDYQLYNCERWRKTTSNEKTSPCETRANNCSSFVSFSFESCGDLRACIVHEELNHSGHNLQDDSHKAVSSINKELLEYIQSLFTLGYSFTEVLLESVKWSEGKGFSNKADRRYFPTPCDINNLKKSYIRSVHFDANDAVSTDHLLKSDLKDDVLLYQTCCKESNTPLLIVLQSQKQKEDMQQFGANMLFLDASFSGLTAYGYAVYIISARNSYGNGIPVCSIIMSTHDTENLIKCLQAFRENADGFYPKAFMVDKDLKLVDAINTVYSDVVVRVLLCWFHVLQAIYRWLVSAKGGGMSGADSQNRKQHVINCIRRLKHCKAEQDFNAEFSQMELPQKVKEYLSDNWICIGKMWSNFGRQFFHEDSDTNNLSERMFLRLKYQFLRGWANRRLDDLLILLSTTVKSYFQYIQELQSHGRIKNQRSEKAKQSIRKAEMMLAAGIGDQIVWQNEHDCFVPSQSQPHSMQWNVNLVTYTCTCPVANYEGGCKHIHLSSLIAQRRGINLQEKRTKIAGDIFLSKDYILEGKQILISNDEFNINSVVDLANLQCNCAANSQKIDCVCLQLASLVKDSLETVPMGEQSLEDQSQEVNSSQNDDSNKLPDLCNMLNFLAKWAKSDEFEPIPGVEKLITRSYNLVNRSFHNRSKTTRRRITPLHPHRKDIENRKKLALEQHNYAIVKKGHKRPSVKRKTPIDFHKAVSSLRVKKKTRAKTVSQICPSV